MTNNAQIRSRKIAAHLEGAYLKIKVDEEVLESNKNNYGCTEVFVSCINVKYLLQNAFTYQPNIHCIFSILINNFINHVLKHKYL